VHVLEEGEDILSEISWSPHGDQIITGSRYGLMKVWEDQSGVLIKNFHDDVGNAWEASWSPYGDRVSVKDRDGSVIVFDGNHFNIVYELHLEEEAWHLSWSPEGKRLALGEKDKK
jgi:WD40 repeat protein